MSRHVALLRAVNVGGRSKVAMADLRAAAEAIGLAEVATVLHAGSLVFTAKGLRSGFEGRLEARLGESLGLMTDVMVRSAEEWCRAVSANPFGAMAQTDPSHLLLLALKTPAKPSAGQDLQRAIGGREEVRMSGDMAYIAYPDGIGRSKLTSAVLERHLGTPGTGRNWNTVLKIAALLGASPGLSAPVN